MARLCFTSMSIARRFLHGDREAPLISIIKAFRRRSKPVRAVAFSITRRDINGIPSAGVARSNANEGSAAKDFGCCSVTLKKVIWRSGLLSRQVSEHDFSRAVRALKMTWALAPEQSVQPRPR